MVLEFIGADREVTGSCHYLTFGDTHILIDCGMEQGADLYVNQDTGQSFTHRLCVCHTRTH